MATIQLPLDFKEFLKLLNSHQIKYLLIGGYAVNYHGYPRTTGDIDIWVAIQQENAEKLVDTLREFGFESAQLTVDLFMKEDQIVRMGIPPFRIELLTTISGVNFEECYLDRITDVIDDVEVQIISLEHLKLNKQASGRYKDLDDLENL
ncbi:MAG: nucleotidyltransferase [Candidatus Poribacteria bacterium]|nr:nucleotidyltransferase [Candidatus Poribacteria bacterium]